jgi:hypothetical protein
MKAYFPFGWPALLLTAAIGLAGCALETAQTAPETRMRFAADQPVPTDRAVPAKPERKGLATKAEANKSKSAAAKPAPQSQAKGQDETSCVSVENCTSVLKAMVASGDRSWMQRPVAPAVLANGVRLFAYRALASRLSCDELTAALSEVGMATRAFSGPVAGLDAEQVERIRSLSAEVGGELRAERVRRCPHHDQDIG